MNVMMIRNTPSNGDTPNYQISLPNLERQTSYGPDKILPLFDLGVKGQGQMNVMMVCNTLSNGDAPTYQISLSYLKGQKSYDSDKHHPLFCLYMTLGSKVKVK